MLKRLQGNGYQSSWEDERSLKTEVLWMKMEKRKEVGA